MQPLVSVLPADGLLCGIAPLALARTFWLKRLTLVASTSTPAESSTPRSMDAFAESFRIAMPNAPPKPTEPPTAAASTTMFRIMLPLARTASPPESSSVSSALLRYASVARPLTDSASTGTIALPPAAPAAASTCSLPV